ncbi:MAG TPA: stage III sporulation protein AE [Thermoclostridium sp.]|nr:stage III sporulation protein AE [Thermoclostridium sp.]
MQFLSRLLESKGFKRIFCTLIALMFFAAPSISYAKENLLPIDNILEEQLDSNEIQRLQKELEKTITDEAKELLPYYTPKKLMQQILSGNVQDGIKTLPQNILDIFIIEIKDNFNIVVKLMLVVFLSSFIKNLQSSFKEGAVGELVYFTCYAAVVTILALGFQSVLKYADEILDTVENMTSIAIPSLLALLISSGNIVSGTALQPIILIVIQATIKIFKEILLPLCLMAGILHIVSGLSERIKISSMASLLRQIVTWAIGVILMLYSSLMAIQGVTGAIIDGATVKTAKTAINTFIPVAGKYMTDATDTIINCALVIKNATGVTVMIITLVTCCIPIIKMLVLVIMYRFTAALIEPFAEESFFDCVSDVSDCMKTIVGVVAASVAMLLLSIVVLLGTGGISGMLQ